MADAKIRVTAKDETKGVLSRLKQSIGGFNLAAIGATVSLGGLALATRKIIQLSSEQELAEKKLAATLKSTSGAAGLTFDELTKLASSLQRTSTYGDEAIISAESLLLTFTKIGKDVFPQATKTLLDLSAGMGQDLKQSAIQLGKALNDPVQGVAALRRVGVQLSPIQEEQIKRFVELGDVASAQKIILEELNIQFGGQAQAQAESFSGKISRLSNAFGDFLEGIGNFLTKNTLFIGAIDLLTNAFGFLAERIRTDTIKELEDFQVALNKAAFKAQLARLSLKGISDTTKELTTDTEDLKKAEEELLKLGLAPIVDPEETVKKAIAAKQEEVDRKNDLEIKRLENEIKIFEEEIGILEENAEKKKQIESDTLAWNQEQQDLRINQLKEGLDFRLQIEAQNQAAIVESNKSNLDKMLEDWNNYSGLVDQAQVGLVQNIQTGLSGLLQSIADTTKTGSTKWKEFGDFMLGSFISVISSMVTKWVVGQSVMALATKQRALTDVAANTASAGSGAAASQAPIPFVGPVLALAAMASMIAVVGALKGSFQTPFGNERIVGGGVNEAVPIIAHGGERVGRGGGGLTINFTGTTFNADETASAIAEMLRSHQIRTGELITV